MDFAPFLDFIFSFFGILFKVLGQILTLFIQSSEKAIKQVMAILGKGGRL